MDKKIIFSVFVVSLFIRLGYVVFLRPDPLQGDSYSWMLPANNILSGKGYGDVMRPPVYPLFITLLFLIFGKAPVIITFFQSIFGALNCVLIYLIGKKVFSAEAGIISAILFSFYPYSIFYTGVILSETLLAFLICLTVLLILYAGENKSYTGWIFAGICAGITVLCKAVVLVFILMVPLWIIYNRVEIEAFKKIFVFLLFVFITILPWSFRNYFFYKKFVLVGFGGMDFWLSNNDSAIQLETISESNRPADKSWCWYPEKRYNEIMKLPRTEADKIFWEEGISWVKNNKEIFLWLVLLRLRHFFRPWPVMATFKQKIVAGLTSGVYLFFAFIGIFISWKRYYRKTLLLLIVIAGFTIAYLPFYCMIRYRFPIDSLILLFTGYVFWEIAKRIKFINKLYEV